MNASHREENQAALADLRALVGRLSEADLDRPLGGGWTVKAALLHLAFWDRFAASVLDAWQQTGVRERTAEDDEHINRAALPGWLAAPPGYALREVLEAAALADQRAAGVAAPLRDAMDAVNESWAYRRHLHRAEHLAQMQSVTGTR